MVYPRNATYSIDWSRIYDQATIRDASTAKTYDIFSSLLGKCLPEKSSVYIPLQSSVRHPRASGAAPEICP